MEPILVHVDRLSRRLRAHVSEAMTVAMDGILGGSFRARGRAIRAAIRTSRRATAAETSAPVVPVSRPAVYRTRSRMPTRDLFRVCSRSQGRSNHVGADSAQGLARALAR